MLQNPRNIYETWTKGLDDSVLGRREENIAVNRAHVNSRIHIMNVTKVLDSHHLKKIYSPETNIEAFLSYQIRCTNWSRMFAEL